MPAEILDSCCFNEPRDGCTDPKTCQCGCHIPGEPSVIPQLAAYLSDIAVSLGADTSRLRTSGWHVTAQQLRNATYFIRDAQRRLENGDDVNG